MKRFLLSYKEACKELIDRFISISKNSEELLYQFQTLIFPSKNSKLVINLTRKSTSIQPPHFFHCTFVFKITAKKKQENVSNVTSRFVHIELFFNFSLSCFPQNFILAMDRDSKGRNFNARETLVVGCNQ